MNRKPRRCAPLALASALAACSAPPPPPPPAPTDVTLSIAADKDINPTADGHAAPLVLRVYQLASPAAFQNADFFPLYNADAATLGADLVKRDDVQISPGETKTLSLTPSDPAKAIGLFAALRGFQTATWRAAAPVPQHQITTVTVTLDHDGIHMKAQSAPPPPPPKPPAK